MKLFIGNLSYEATESDLREALAPHEPILELRRPHDKETGKPRGFAFVTLASREEGEKAIAALDGSKIRGRALRVNEAEDRQGHHEGGRPPRVSLKVEKSRDVDARPIGPDGKRIRYKGI